MVTNLLIVLLNGLLIVTDTLLSWLASFIGLLIVTQFARWEIAFDRDLRRGVDDLEELL